MSDPPLNENILLTRRKHWIVLFLELLGNTVVMLTPFVIYFLLDGKEIAINDQMYLLEMRPALFVFAGSIWLIFFWMRLIHIWTDYYLDVWTITDRRIIDREQRGLFNRQTSVFHIDRIQDVTIETRGILPTLFHFGDIHVQTAGESQQFIMRGIADPKYVREVILAQQDRTVRHAEDETPLRDRINESFTE